MIIVHPNFYNELWDSIAEMIFENYSQGYLHNDIVVVSHNIFVPLEKIKQDYPYGRKYIVYQTEPLTENHWHKPEKIISSLNGYDEVWEHDFDNVNLLKSYGINSIFKPFLYTEKLKKIKSMDEPDIDILFYGTINERRAKLISYITSGVLLGDDNIVIINGITGKKLDEYISRSKIILDLHTDEDKIQKQSRLFYGIINDKCILSEKSSINYFGDLIIEFTNENMNYVIRKVLREKIWKSHSEGLSEKFKNRTIYDIINCI